MFISEPGLPDSSRSVNADGGGMNNVDVGRHMSDAPALDEELILRMG